jgi:hypothetical protein
MLPRLVLTIVQLAVGWSYAPQLRSLVPLNIGGLEIFFGAVIVAVLVWLAGHVGALVLKDTPAPSTATLTACLVLALAGAALTLIPQVPQFINGWFRGGVPTRAYPLIGAVIGYLVRR